MLSTTGLLDMEDLDRIDLIWLEKKKTAILQFAMQISAQNLMPLKRSNQLWTDHPQ